jgi:hypothetical protein
LIMSANSKFPQARDWRSQAEARNQRVHAAKIVPVVNRTG